MCEGEKSRFLLWSSEKLLSWLVFIARVFDEFLGS